MRAGDELGRKLGVGVTIVVVVTLAAMAGVGFWKGSAKVSPTTAQAVAPVASKTVDVRPLMPTKADADAQVIAAASDLSKLPGYAIWLRMGDLARTFVSTMDAIAEGRSPREVVLPLAPQQAFTVKKEGHRLEISQASYDRFNTLADIVGSIDAQRAAEAYKTLHTLLTAAYQEIAPPDSTLDERVAEAMDRVEKTPVQKEPVQVIGRHHLFMFVDDKLEELTPASKCLLRMGPRNMKIIQAKVAEFAAALHLPTPISAKAPAKGHSPG